MNVHIYGNFSFSTDTLATFNTKKARIPSDKLLPNLYNLRFGSSLSEGIQAFFVLNVANVSVENEKLAWTTSGNLTYPTMKDTLKKVFADISLSEYKTIPVIKEETETVNFNQ